MGYAHWVGLLAYCMRAILSAPTLRRAHAMSVVSLKYDKRKFYWRGGRCDNLHYLYFVESLSGKMADGGGIGDP